jgi:hypothetical protein
MDTLCILSEDISYNATDEIYEVDCHIVIMQNDTLKLLAGETIKFLSYPGGPPIRYELVIYGNLIAIGKKDKIITLGDPEATFSIGDWWQGIKFINTSHYGESKLKYCNIRGAVNLQIFLETAIYCENSSPIIDHCLINYSGSSELFGGASGIGLRHQSYPIISYCEFANIINGVAVWCNPYGIQDTIDSPSPLMVGCNIYSSVTGINWAKNEDYAILNGGFLDNCYLAVGLFDCDTSLGYLIDTIGDGLCKTTSNYDNHPRYILVDGVKNPRDTFLITDINEYEINLLPTTTNYLVLNNNYPNPFSNFTTISFEVAKHAANISLAIYDSKGNLVREIIKAKDYNQGSYKVDWRGENDSGEKVKEGIYFYKLTSGGYMMVKKAIVIK